MNRLPELQRGQHRLLKFNRACDRTGSFDTDRFRNEVALQADNFCFYSWLVFRRLMIFLALPFSGELLRDESIYHSLAPNHRGR